MSDYTNKINSELAQVQLSPREYSFGSSGSSFESHSLSSSSSSSRNGSFDSPTVPNIDLTPEAIDMTGEGGVRGPPQACLHVAGISSETTESTLRNFFGSFGELIRVRVVSNQARPYAFVQFKFIQSADQALMMAPNQSVDGRKLRLERARVNRTLFIAKIDRNLSAAQIREVMEGYGEVEAVTLIKNHRTQRSKGCGFVKYLYREDASKAFSALKAVNKKWVVEWAQSNNDPESLGIDRSSLFVGGLNPAEVTRELLNERFSQYGGLESVTIINKDPDVFEAQDVNFPRSAFAFIRFSDPSSSASCIEHENGAEWLDRKIRVQYCESQEMKNKRKANKYFNFVNSYVPQQFYPQLGQMPPYPYPYPLYNSIPAPTLSESGQPDYVQPYMPYPPYMIYSDPYLYPQFPQYPYNASSENGSLEDEGESDAQEEDGANQHFTQHFHGLNIKSDHVDSAAR